MVFVITLYNFNVQCAPFVERHFLLPPTLNCFHRLFFFTQIHTSFLSCTAYSSGSGFFFSLFSFIFVWLYPLHAQCDFQVSPFMMKIKSNKEFYKTELNTIYIWVSPLWGVLLITHAHMECNEMRQKRNIGQPGKTTSRLFLPPFHWLEINIFYSFMCAFPRLFDFESMKFCTFELLRHMMP